MLLAAAAAVATTGPLRAHAEGRTTAQIDTNINSNQSSLSTAKETLERIRERQAREEDRQTASASLEKELTGADLDEKLKAAGIDSEQDAVNDVLARLKGSQAQ